MRTHNTPKNAQCALYRNLCQDASRMQKRCRISSRQCAAATMDSQICQRDENTSFRQHRHRAFPACLAIFIMQCIMVLRVAESCNLPSPPAIRSLPRFEIDADNHLTVSTRLILEISLSAAMHGYRSDSSAVHFSHATKENIPLKEGVPALAMRQRRHPKITRSIEINN